MSDKTILYLVVTIVVFHFVFAIVYLFWKVLSAKKPPQKEIKEELKTSDK